MAGLYSFMIFRKLFILWLMNVTHGICNKQLYLLYHNNNDSEPKDSTISYNEVK